tara:strand:- start:959 stop:2095 length:1137 start_codon:yes stop_codon:yes gene_type:complete
MPNQKIRVLHFFKTYLPDSFGGIEQFINQICRGGSKQGIESVVLTLSENPVPEKIQVDGHDVWRCKLDFNIASTGLSIGVCKKFKELVEQADIVHYQYPWPMMDLAHFFAAVKKPTIVSYQSDIVRQKMLLNFYRPLQNKFLSSVDKIVASSPNYFATSEVLQKYQEKVSVIPIGMDKATYTLPSNKKMNEWRNVLGDKFFLFIGVLRYYKGLHILIEAARTAKYPIVIVGAGPIEAELKAQASNYGLTNIHFTGRLAEEDKVALLQLSYAVVFPSHLRSEAFGISLLEGAMFGKTMISSEIGTGTTFINIDGETGLVVPPSDAISLSQAMTWLWEHPEESAEMGKNAEQRYWKLFTAEAMVEKYVELYRELVSKANL